MVNQRAAVAFDDDDDDVRGEGGYLLNCLTESVRGSEGDHSSHELTSNRSKI